MKALGSGLVVGSLVPVAVFGATRTWDGGAANGDWTNGANWNADGDAVGSGLYPNGNGQTVVLGFACSDEDTVLTTGQKIGLDMPFAFTASRIYATLKTAPTTTAVQIDLEDEGTSMLNAVLSISTTNNNAETSTFASAASSYDLSKGDLFAIDIDQADAAATGLKVFMVGTYNGDPS